MQQRVSVSGAGLLAERETRKFSYEEEGARKEGFIVRAGGNLYAYRNECRHIPVTLDWMENRFLSRDRCYLQCATHGALFELETGLCIDGPPLGESLHALEFELDGDDAIVSVPIRATRK